jgi:hypothetical protein
MTPEQRYEAMRRQVHRIHQIVREAEMKADEMRDQMDARQMPEGLLPDLEMGMAAALVEGLLPDLEMGMAAALVETGYLRGLAHGLLEEPSEQLDEGQTLLLEEGAPDELPADYDMFVEELDDREGLVVTASNGAYVLPGGEISYDRAYFYPSTDEALRAAWAVFRRGA